MNSVTANLSSIKERIKRAAKRVNRNSGDIKLVAVSKRISPEKILEATQSGQLLFGENYLQDAKDKFLSELLQSQQNLKLHFIGHLQTNKAKEAIALFDVIETVDRLKLALTLDKHLDRADQYQGILIQVNIGREPQKSGILPEDTAKFIQQIRGCSHLNIKGLMAIPPFSNNHEDSRVYFRSMKKLAKTLIEKNILNEEERELSMGMSNDFEVAIEEGSTLIRVGTAIFGQRQ